MIKQIVVGFFLTFLSIKTYALELEYFQCPNESSAVKCSQNCTSYGTVRFESEVKSGGNKILLVIKDQNNTIVPLNR